jgi:aldose 1-epimerase
MPASSASDLVNLAAGDAQVEITPLTGAAVAAFRFRGVDILRPTPPQTVAAKDVRGYACYPLVPYSNRIANARLVWNGREYALERNFGDHPHSIHGVGWQREWRVDTRDNDSALLTLDYSSPAEAGAPTPVAWPWPFRAVQSFELSSTDKYAQLLMRLTLTNTGDVAFPFGLGWHPFFPRTASAELAFAAGGVWETDPTKLPTRLIAIPPEWRFDPPRHVGASAIDNVFTDWTGSATLTDTQRRIAVTLDADRACRFVVVYVPEDRDYLAVEPVTHMTDAFNRSAQGEAVTGTRIVRPGEAFSTTMRLSVRPLT